MNKEVLKLIIFMLFLFGFVLQPIISHYIENFDCIDEPNQCPIIRVDEE